MAFSFRNYFVHSYNPSVTQDKNAGVQTLRGVFTVDHCKILLVKNCMLLIDLQLNLILVSVNSHLRTRN